MIDDYNSLLLLCNAQQIIVSAISNVKWYLHNVTDSDITCVFMPFVSGESIHESTFCTAVSFYVSVLKAILHCISKKLSNYTEPFRRFIPLLVENVLWTLYGKEKYTF